MRRGWDDRVPFVARGVEGRIVGTPRAEWVAHVEGATRMLEEAGGLVSETEAVVWARKRAGVRALVPHDHRAAGDCASRASASAGALVLVAPSDISPECVARCRSYWIEAGADEGSSPVSVEAGSR